MQEKGSCSDIAHVKSGYCVSESAFLNPGSNAVPWQTSLSGWDCPIHGGMLSSVSRLETHEMPEHPPTPFQALSRKKSSGHCQMSPV